MKLTKEAILKGRKAREECLKKHSRYCDCFGGYEVIENLLDTIDAMEKEIERLKAINEAWRIKQCLT